MNLNAQALEEFGSDEVTSDGVILVATPGPTQITVPQAGQEVRPTADELFDGPVVKNELPTLEAEFVVFEDMVDHATDVEAVKNRLEEANAIDRSEAMAIESIVPGFVHKRMPLAGFTSHKTSTQLKQARESIDDQLASQLCKLAVNVKDLAQKVGWELHAFHAAMDDRLLAIQNAGTEVFLRFITQKKCLSENLWEELEVFAGRKDAASPELREQIRSLVHEIPGSGNVRYFLNNGARPIIVINGTEVVVYQNNTAEVWLKKDYIAQDNNINYEYVSVKQAMDSLFGEGLIKNFAGLKNALAITKQDIDAVGPAVDALVSETDARVCGQALALLGAQVKTKYTAASCIMSLVNNLEKLTTLFIQVFESEIEPPAPGAL